MPKRKQPAEKSSSSANGEKSKAKLSVPVDQSDNESDGDEHSGNDAESTTAADDHMTDFVAIKDQLLQKMEAAVHSTNVKLGHFDFSSIQIEGRTKEELAACYSALRRSALRHIRQLRLREEIQFVKENERLKTKSKAKAAGPKRPLTSFFRYKDDAIEKLKKRQPDLKFTEMVKVVAEQWRNMSPEKKRPYQEASEKEMEKFRQDHPELVSKRTAKENGPANKRSKVVKPKTAFELFCEAKRKEYSEKYELKGPELEQKLAIKFGKLSDRKRQKWDDRAKELMDEYINALASKGSQSTTDQAAANVSFEEPIPQSQIEKEEKSKVKKRKKSTADGNDYMDTLLSGAGASSQTQTPKSSKGSKSNASKDNNWLYG